MAEGRRRVVTAERSGEDRKAADRNSKIKNTLQTCRSVIDCQWRSPTQSSRRTVAGNLGDRLFQETATLKKLEIRESVRSESGTIESLYPDALPDENLLPLVRDLLQDSTVTTSLVGIINSRVVGHAIFTKCGVAESNFNVVLLGPLVVAPAWQRQGIGSAIVRAGLRRLEEADVGLVFVLGDPAYYRRLGFLPESLVEPPFRLPAEWGGAWQSQSVGDIKARCPGKLSVPRQWLQPALWAP